MNTVSIDASPSQIRKLKKGHKVRVKKGTGFEIIVHPTTYNIVSRAFAKNKGAQIALTPAELEANTALSKAISPEAHNPSLTPKIAGSGIRGKTLHGASHDIKLADALNEHLGSNYGYLARAGLDNAINGRHSASLTKMGIDSRYGLSPSVSTGPLEPYSRMIGGSIEKSSIGRNGGMLSIYTPPALVSQPFSANFQFQHFLPPQYQHFSASGSSGIGGSGLYLS